MNGVLANGWMDAQSIRGNWFKCGGLSVLLRKWETSHYNQPVVRYECEMRPIAIQTSARPTVIYSNEILTAQNNNSHCNKLTNQIEHTQQFSSNRKHYIAVKHINFNKCGILALFDCAAQCSVLKPISFSSSRD